MSDHITAATDASFEKDVLDFKGVVLVDFWATWCGPCQLLAPTMEEIAASYTDKEDVKIVKVDVDQNPNVSEKFDVRSIPTLKYFKNGEAVDQVVGVQTKDELVRRLEAARS